MFKNHPRGLQPLFFTEIWERFGFYILMAVLVLYMDQEFGWDDSRKGSIYGWFLGLVYFIPILGGWLGDRILGPKRTIKIGAALMLFGYVFLTLSATDRVWCFYLGLFLIAVGTGIFKVNMSVSIGSLYSREDGRKDAAFNIYYMGVNIGATVAPMAATLISAALHSYRISFAAAAVGMVFCLIIFRQGQKHLSQNNTAAAATLPSDAAATAPTDKREDRQRVITLIILFAIVIFFWVAFYQNYFTMTLFAQRSTITSHILRPETYQFFNPFFILVLTPPMLALFARLRARGKEPASPVKIFSGMLFSGFSMLVMVFAALAGGNLDQNNMSPLWLISAYFIVTIGEILVSPMGQSFVSRVAPQRLQGLMMGLWFGATAVGSYLSGQFGRYYSDFQHHQYFLILMAMLFFAALLVLLSMKKLRRFAESGGRTDV
ncbi:peptide MFS transporter [candidate division KSB1 bacterium]|nr:peptide MFS transporter [candidate division KSB1 bacterium]